jgi:hypothetical protein
MRQVEGQGGCHEDIVGYSGSSERFEGPPGQRANIEPRFLSCPSFLDRGHEDQGRLALEGIDVFGLRDWNNDPGSMIFRAALKPAGFVT